MLAGSVALIYRAEIRTFLSEMKAVESNSIDRKSTAVGDEFDAIVGDLLFLSRQNELHAYFEQPDSRLVAAIQSEYLAMAEAR